MTDKPQQFKTSNEDLEDLKAKLHEQRASGEKLSDHWLDVSRTYIEESSSVFRWVFASCLSLNGGAIVAALSLGESDKGYVAAGVASFSAGVIILIIAGARHANVTWRLSHEWALLAFKLRMGEEGFSWPPGLEELVRAARRTVVAQYASLVCFSIGVVALLEGVR